MTKSNEIEEAENTTGARGMGNSVVGASQDAAEFARTTAQRAADKLPDAVAGVQVAATHTQRRLDDMPSDGLLVGTSFSLGMAVALFLSGANRFLVVLAAAPAVAMALTILGRGRDAKIKK